MKYKIKMDVEMGDGKYTECLIVKTDQPTAEAAIMFAASEALEKLQICHDERTPSTFKADATHPDYYGLADGLDVLAIMPPAERFIFAKWNAVKYCIRCGKKMAQTASEDLKKAIRYIEVMIDVLEKGSKD